MLSIANVIYVVFVICRISGIMTRLMLSYSFFLNLLRVFIYTQCLHLFQKITYWSIQCLHLEENIKSAFSCFFRKFTFFDLSKAIGKGQEKWVFFPPKTDKKSNFAFPDAVKDFFPFFTFFPKKRATMLCPGFFNNLENFLKTGGKGYFW